MRKLRKNSTPTLPSSSSRTAKPTGPMRMSPRRNDSASISVSDSPAAGRDDEIAALVSAPRVERTVGEAPAARRATTYDADDLEIPSFLRRK